MNEPSNFVEGSVEGCTNNSLDNPPFTPREYKNQCQYFVREVLHIVTDRCVGRKPYSENIMSIGTAVFISTLQSAQYVWLL